MTPPPDGPRSVGGVPVELTGALLREGAATLTAAGSETARLDAELLLGHAVGVGRTVVLAHPEAPVGVDAARRYRADIARRADGEPVAYIRGLKEFYGLAFETDPRALIPRPETERLVELAQAEVMGQLGAVARPIGAPPLRVVDVGTGSGAIAIALAVGLRRLRALEAVDVLATDISADALGLARENAVGHAVADRVRFVEADLLPTDDTGPFDVVLANLPYVRTDVIATLPRATSFEPVLALDGGPDGLDVIGRLLDMLPVALAPEGVALLEIGSDQGAAVVECVAARLPGWTSVVEADLAGMPRVAGSDAAEPRQRAPRRSGIIRDVPEIVTPRPILPIGMVALDIDGTLVGDDLVIGPDTRAAIRSARERGVIVSLITGRMVSSALRFARELDLISPIVGYQGALIREMPGVTSTRPGRMLIHTPLKAAVAREVVVWARQQGLDPHVNHLERFIIRSDDPLADEYTTFMGHTPDRADDLVASIRHPVTKVMCHGEPPLPTEVAPLARARFAGMADVTVSHPHFIEFVAPGVSKGRAVRWLARRLGVDLGAVLAIGDQWNDIEMLAEVGHGAAMPTAPREVQAVARYIAPPLGEEGVARMIETLVLAKPSDVEASAIRLADQAAADRLAMDPVPA